MGIKALKQRFGIEHIVHKDGDELCIGSGYCPKLIMINLKTMEVTSSSIVTDHSELAGLKIRLSEAQAEGSLRRTVESPDTYSTTYTVFYESNGRILTTKCEKLGWPNITLDGELMYDNQHFKTRKEALVHARSGANGLLKWRCEQFIHWLGELKKRLCVFKTLWHTFRIYVLRGY